MHRALSALAAAAALLAAASLGACAAPASQQTPSAHDAAPHDEHEDEATRGDATPRPAVTRPAPQDPDAPPPFVQLRDSVCMRSCVEQSGDVAANPGALEQGCAQSCARCVEACAGRNPSTDKQKACDEQCAGGDRHGSGAP